MWLSCGEDFLSVSLLVLVVLLVLVFVLVVLLVAHQLLKIVAFNAYNYRCWLHGCAFRCKVVGVGV